MAEIVSEAWQLRVVGVSDQERGAAGENHHRYDDALASDIAHRLSDVREAAHGAPRRRLSLAETRSVRRIHQPQHQGQVEHRVEQDAG